MINKAILMGRITRDPELRYTQSNKPVCSFNLAIDRAYQQRGQERQTDFINVVAWDQRAQFVEDWFVKGMMMIVIGRIQSRSYTDRDGKRRTAVEVVAEEIRFGETKKQREQSAAAAGNDRTETPDTPIPEKYTGNDFEELADDGEIPF